MQRKDFIFSYWLHNYCLVFANMCSDLLFFLLSINVETTTLRAHLVMLLAAKICFSIDIPENILLQFTYVLG